MLNNPILNDHQTILLNSKGYELVQSNLDGQYNLIDNRNGLVIHSTHKLSVMVKYLSGMQYI